MRTEITKLPARLNDATDVFEDGQLFLSTRKNTHSSQEALQSQNKVKREKKIIKKETVKF